MLKKYQRNFNRIRHGNSMKKNLYSSLNNNNKKKKLKNNKRNILKKMFIVISQDKLLDKWHKAQENVKIRLLLFAKNKKYKLKKLLIIILEN